MSQPSTFFALKLPQESIDLRDFGNMLSWKSNYPFCAIVRVIFHLKCYLKKFWQITKNSRICERNTNGLHLDQKMKLQYMNGFYRGFSCRFVSHTIADWPRDSKHEGWWYVRDLVNV